MRKVYVLMSVVAAALIVTDARAFRITTADPGGADVELREESPTMNRGDSPEIASRVFPSATPTAWRNSAIYLKFGVAGISAIDLADDIMVQTTYRNSNLAPVRFQDTVGDIGPNTGWDYFVLDPTMSGANWDESAITPSNAPGSYVDGDYTTKLTTDSLGSLNPGLTYLGRKLYDSADLVDGHLPVGGPLNFSLSAGSALHQAIVAAQATDHKTLTIIMQIAHNYDNENTWWLNFNYLFNPKEMLTLNPDPDSLWSTHRNSNADNYYSPTLMNLPEPATITLLGFGVFAVLRKRK